MIAFSFLVEKIDFVIPWPQISVYKLYAQIARLTTLCIEFSMKIPTIWYIATLVPLGVQRILFLPGSSKGLMDASDPPSSTYSETILSVSLP